MTRKSRGRETAPLVSLCADQIGEAIEEATGEIDTLVESFLVMVRHAASLTRVANELPGRRSDEEQTSKMAADSDAMRSEIDDMFRRLQYGDRLNQRPQNVCGNLAALAGLLHRNEPPISARAWRKFLEEIRTNYTSEHERQMFEKVIDKSVLPVQTPIAKNLGRQPSKGLELFESDATDG